MAASAKWISVKKGKIGLRAGKWYGIIGEKEEKTALKANAFEVFPTSSPHCGRNEAVSLAHPVPAAAVRGVYAQALPADGSASAVNEAGLSQAVPDELALRGRVRTGEPHWLD